MALAARLPKLCAGASSPNADLRSSTGAGSLVCDYELSGGRGCSGALGWSLGWNR
jgi:hypothetical protein